MIQYIDGDMFESGADIMVNTVNCVGIMGKGVALEFKNRNPKMFEKYKKDCSKKNYTPGRPMVVIGDNGETIINFPTKDDWRNQSEMGWIETGLYWMMKFCCMFPNKSIAMPKLGCGNGGLLWPDVNRLIKKYLGDVPNTIFVYGDDE